MDKKRYWLKLDKDFMKSSQIKVIKNMPNGKDYIIFYLSLLLESIESVGHLKFSENVPYSDEMLASVTDTNIDIVRSACKIFSSLGLMQILDDGTLYMTQVAQMTGKESDSAERVRQYRLREKQKKLLQCNTDVTNSNIDVTNSNDNIYIEHNINNNINNNIQNTITNIYSYIESNFGRTLSPVEYETIESWLSLFKEEIINHAVEIAVLNNKKTFNYVNGILNNWNACGYKTLQEIKDQENKLKRTSQKIDENKKELFDYDWLNDSEEG